ncbi:hypothetical protein ACQP00_29110 [Dactylosporangium sp. CS-047395]|uniref:hypothetical protein n=1 Tax=Dactylosporangium sp. CS-047395 TaxID=3239936 RepID=UPI003D90EC01
MNMVVLLCGDFGGPCPSCGAAVAFHVAEAVDAGRVMWTATSRCGGCGYIEQDRASPAEFDDVAGIVRLTLVAQVGLTRLHADPDENRALRLRSLAVFRRRGATIHEVADAYAALTGPGLTGTPAEMSVLAEHLTAEGVRVTLQPHHADRNENASARPASRSGRAARPPQ